MFTYDMSKAGANSLYHYLYQCIKKDIVSGNILAEEQLPSKRNLAQNLGVSVVTVENAYAQLLTEGFIYSLPKKGFFVAGAGSGGRYPSLCIFEKMHIFVVLCVSCWLSFASYSLGRRQRRRQTVCVWDSPYRGLW